MLLLNAHYEPLPFSLPVAAPGAVWEVVFDTARPELAEGACSVREGGEAIAVEARSLLVLRRGA